MASPVVFFAMVTGVAAIGAADGWTPVRPITSRKPVALQAVAPPILPERVSPDVVIIDGKVEPERIPEHMIWRDAFYLVAHLNRQAAKPGTSDASMKLYFSDGIRTVELSSRDARILGAAADTQKDRDRICEGGLREIIGRLSQAGKTPEEIGEALVEPIISCRVETIETRDRVLSQMSEQGAADLREWVNDRRSMTTLSVSNGELPYLMRPQ